jgi:autotransporter-associated beta strand protein
MKISINNSQKTPRQNPARGTSARPVAALITALFVTVLLGGTSVQAVQYWIAKSEADWSSSPTNWTSGGIPTNNLTDQVYFTNGIACDYGMLSDTDSCYLIYVGGTNNNCTGILNITNGTLCLTNQATYNLVVGGGAQTYANFTGGSNSVGTVTVSGGGTLNVTVLSNPNEYKDSVLLGLGTNSTGTLTITNNGTANLQCGLDIGINGSGIVNVGSNGTLAVNGWFADGRGQTNSGIGSSGTFNLSGGAVYILPNAYGPTPGVINGGLCLDNYSTNSTVNISGGTLYACRIDLNSYTNTIGGVIITNADTLNISGGMLYIGSGGVNSNLMTAGGSSVSYQSVNISGGTFHTADMLLSNSTNGSPPNAGFGVNGAITNVTGLTDGTNWIWAANPPVNLTNSSFTVNGVSGPGYVTFAPEIAGATARSITLNNVWAGVGGMNIAGPGQTRLEATNTYTGDTVISGGRLSLADSCTIASSNIIVANGATFDLHLIRNTNTVVNGFTNIYLLASGQTLSNSASPAFLEGGINSDLGTISLTYASNTPSFLCTTIGTLTLSNYTTFNVNNTGSPLGPGTYTLIGTTNGTKVAGTVPSSPIVVGGSGALGTSSLNISTSNTLDLVVVASAPVVSPIISGPSVKVTVSGNPTFSGTGASDLTVYGVESTTSLSTKPVVWIEATNVVATPGVPGVTTGSDGSWSFTDANQTNPPTIFYRLYNPDTPGSPPQGHYNYDYDGSIITGTTGDGVYMGDGGSVNNLTNGIITGGWNGVEIDGAIGSVVNAGSITGTTGIGVYLSDGGSVDNLTSGIITGGSYGVQITNAGSIIGTNGYGVYLGDGGSVDNLTNGIINQH